MNDSFGKNKITKKDFVPFEETTTYKLFLIEKYEIEDLDYFVKKKLSSQNSFKNTKFEVDPN